MGDHGRKRSHHGYGGGDHDWRRDDRRDDDRQTRPYRQDDYEPDERQEQVQWRGRGAPRLRIPWITVAAGLAAWSALAAVVYVLVDPALTWVASNAGLLADSGKAAATTAGGEVAAAAVQALNVTTLLGQIIDLLRTVAKPLVALVWAIGAAALLLAPAILPRVVGASFRGRAGLRAYSRRPR